MGRTTNALPAQPATLVTGIFPWLRPEAEGLRINLRQPDQLGRWPIAPFLPAAVSAPSPLPLDGFQPNPILSCFGFIFQLDHDRAPSEPGMPFRLVHRAQMASVPSSGPFHLRRTPNIAIEPYLRKTCFARPLRSDPDTCCLGSHDLGPLCGSSRPTFFGPIAECGNKRNRAASVGPSHCFLENIGFVLRKSEAVLYNF
jgi:hypothetical protein